MTRPSNDFPVPLITMEQTSSTNNYLRKYCNRRQSPVFTTVTANFQTGGRGQRGNTWESEASRNLLFSFVLFPEFLEARRQFLLSQIISLSIIEVLADYTKGISIKWPNDIYWQERKICGILIENDLIGDRICQSIVGVGININQQEFHSSAPNPVSLWQITGKEHNRREILTKIILRVKDYYYDQLTYTNSDAIATRYQEALFRKKGLYPYQDTDGTFLAEILRVEPEGLLVLRTQSGEERKYAFKEVQYVL